MISKESISRAVPESDPRDPFTIPGIRIRPIRVPETPRPVIEPRKPAEQPFEEPYTSPEQEPEFFPEEEPVLVPA